MIRGKGGRKSCSRRGFLKSAAAVAALAAVGDISPVRLLAAERNLVRFPEKTDLILLTSRPPQLETPISYFEELITPNEAVFVRWHISNIPTSVDLSQWRLRVAGNTARELRLSLGDLRKMEKITYTAVIECSGNGRSFFDPRVSGGQWGNGAMGNVTWSGARLKDILDLAGVKPGSSNVSFNGLDTPPLPTVPDFVKSISLDKAVEEDVIVAYEMNGKPLPMLNGFPARLIVPGWYATYWVKSLSDISVNTKPFEGFWVKTAYRIPDNECGCVPPGSSPKKMVPINRLTTTSLIVQPSDHTEVRVNQPVEIKGIAFSDGHAIKDVIVSVDGGKIWREAMLGRDNGKYSWVQWSIPWRPSGAGTYTLMARATNSIGESQPFGGLWNPAGYLWNKVEKIEVKVR